MDQYTLLKIRQSSSTNHGKAQQRNCSFDLWDITLISKPASCWDTEMIMLVLTVQYYKSEVSWHSSQRSLTACIISSLLIGDSETSQVLPALLSPPSPASQGVSYAMRA